MLTKKIHYSIFYHFIIIKIAVLKWLCMSFVIFTVHDNDTYIKILAIGLPNFSTTAIQCVVNWHG